MSICVYLFSKHYIPLAIFFACGCKAQIKNGQTFEQHKEIKKSYYKYLFQGLKNSTTSRLIIFDLSTLYFKAKHNVD